MLLDNLDHSARVLVVVVNRPCDLSHARESGWYRIPVRCAPRTLAAEALAFYQTGAFGPERWAVRYLAPVLGVSLASRHMLLPQEPGHPRANERYYRFALGPLEALPVPVASRRLRRITFIPTTLGRLLVARDVVELWGAVAEVEDVWAAGIAGRRVAS